MSDLTKKPTADQIKRLPKALLHDHLDGGLRPLTIVELAAGPDFYSPSFSSRTCIYKGMLISRAWPELPETLVDAKATEEVGWVINLITSIRSARAPSRGLRTRC